MGSKLVRGLGGFGLGLAAGGLAAYGAYKDRKKTEAAVLKALGKGDQVKEPTFKDFWDQSTIGKKINGTQSPAPVSSSTPKAVSQDIQPTTVAEETTDPGTPMGEPMPQEAAPVANYDQDMWTQAPSSDDAMIP